MTTLILVRHGETDWNRERRIQGSTDIPLNDAGRAQARETAEALHASLGDEVPTVVASDLSRARETAEIIAAGLGTRVARLYPGLRERSYGEAEGVDAAEFSARWGDWHGAEVPGAEPWSDLRRRGIRTIRHVVRDARRGSAPASTTVVAVTHGAFIREVIRHATSGELPLAGERLDNGSTFSFLIERERLRLLTYAGVAL
ncbi:MAG: histidine phosphatase family protein [Microbacterium sp.]